MIDWSQHKYGPAVDVIFTPRAEYQGRRLRAELSEFAGARIRVRALWLMSDDDKYQGEWALGAEDRYNGSIFGRTWIASGDVSAAP